VAQLSPLLVQPRKGHIDQVFHIWAWLKKHSWSKMVFGDSMIDWKGMFQPVDWLEIYGDDELPL
jgi:hypothetical protein